MVQSDTREMEWTVGRLLNWTADYFKGKQVEEPMLSVHRCFCLKCLAVLRSIFICDMSRWWKRPAGMNFASWSSVRLRVNR